MALDVPSGHVLGVGAEAADVIIADLEDGAERAAVLAGIAVETNVIFAAVVRMRVAGEGADGHIARLGALESASDLCNFIENKIIKLPFIASWTCLWPIKCPSECAYANELRLC